MAAKKKLPAVGYDQLKPFLSGLQAQQQQRGGPDFAAYDAAWNGAGPAKGADADTDWDKFWRPAGAVLNALSAGGYGVTGAAAKSIDRQRQQLKNPKRNELADLLGNIGALPGDFLGSVGDALGNNTKNLRTGSDVIESGTDLVGERTNLLKHERGITDNDYVDEKDNANPWVKGIGGFAIDVAADPLTYLGPGLVTGAVKGGVKAGRAAAIAKTGGDIAKTGAFVGALPKGGIEGIAKYAADKATQRIATTEMKAQKKAIKDGSANWEDLGGWKVPTGATSAGLRDAATKTTTPLTVTAGIPDSVHKAAEHVDAVLNADKAERSAASAARIIQDEAAKAAKLVDDAAPPVPAERVLPGAAKPGKMPRVPPAAQKAAAAADKLAVDEAQAGAKATATATEVSARGAQAEAMGAPAAAALAALPLQSEKILKTLRALTYTESAMPAAIQSKVRKLAPMERAMGKEAGPARTAWAKEVTDLVGADRMKVLRGIRDPDEFAAKAERFASELVKKSYADKPLSEILGDKRGLNVKRRTHDEAQIKAILKDMGLDGRNLGKSTPTFKDLLLRKDIKERITKLTLEEKAVRSAFGDSGLVGGEVVEELAKAIDVPVVTKGIAEQADELAATLPASHLAAYEASIDDIIPADFAKRFKYERTAKNGELLKATEKKWTKGGENKTGDVWLKHVFNQYKTLTYSKSIIQKGSDLAKAAGLAPAARADFLYDYYRDGVKYLDTRMRGLGVAPVTGKTSVEANMLKSKGVGEWAFLGMSDVLEALPREFGKRFLFAGKDNSGLSTLLQDSGRWALKISHMDGTEADKMNAIYRFLNEGVAKLSGTGVYASKKYLQGEGQVLVKGLAGLLRNPETIARLQSAHLSNSALAVATVGENAQRASRPIIAVLKSRVDSPFGTAGSVSDAILAASKDLDRSLAKEGLTDTLAAGVAHNDLEKAIAQTASVADVQTARNAERMAKTAGDSSGKPLAPEAKQAAKAKVQEAASKATGPGNKGKAPRLEPKTEAHVKAAEKTAKAASTARAAEVTQMEDQVQELLKDVARIAEESGDDVERALLASRAEMTMGLPAWLRATERFGETFHGAFGMDKLKYHEVSLAMSTRKWIAGFNEVVNGIQKKYAPDAQKAAWARIRTMENNDDLARVLEGADPATKAATEEIWGVMRHVFDHSEHTFFDRAGLDADHINEFLRRTRVPEKYWLPQGAQAHELGSAWKGWDFGPDDDPMELLKKYSSSLKQAQTVPQIAASFSAEFGHKSNIFGDALSESEAIAAGWKRIDTNAVGVAKWVDPEQYYPPEMIDQLSRMNIYLNTSKVLDGDGIFDKAFRFIDPVINVMKASITLWRPGHHVTNMMGEGLMNTLAGVTNPARYADSMHILRSQGLLDKGGDDITKLLAKNAPEGFALKAADAGKGVYMTIGGKTSLVGYDSVYKLLDKAGVILDHANAEDLITETAALLGRTGVQHRLDKASHLLSPNWLGKTSAARDNLFRIAHATDILNKRGFRNIDEAMRYISHEVQQFHPTMQNLSAAEQKYVRRVMYFYTWQRQALVKVVEALADTPGRVTVAPKALYNVSEANGTEPQSFGQIMPNDPSIPGYSAGNITSFLWNAGQGGGQTPATDTDSFLWSASISAPQLDILQSVFGGIAVNPDKDGFAQVADSVGQFGAQAVLGGITPAIRVPAELATGAKFATAGQKNGTPIRNKGEYLLDQTGLGYASRAGLFGPRTDDPTVPLDLQARHDSTMKNFITGFKQGEVNGPKAVANAARMRQEELKRMAEEGRLPQ